MCAAAAVAVLSTSNDQREAVEPISARAREAADGVTARRDERVSADVSGYPS
jgi:hypothetical protein